MTREVPLLARVLATTGLLLAVVMQMLDTTIANVALPHMQGSLSASPEQITWVLTSYIVASAIMAPLSGWIALKIGRKPMFLLCIATFVAASVLCGIGTNLGGEVLFRFVQGAAAAGLMPLSQAVLLDLWDAEVVPTIMAIWSGAMMMGPILGPALGGLITEHASWRWVFFINVPFGALAFFLVAFAMPPDTGGKERPFDFLGFASLVLFTGGLQLVMDRGPTVDWFGSREIWVEAIIAACAAYIFAAQMLTAKQPFFDRALMRDRNFVICSLAGFIVQVVLFATGAMLPTMMQAVMGYSPEQSGFTGMYRGVGAAISFAFVPWMMRNAGSRATMIVGIAFTAVGLWLMSRFDLSMTPRSISIAGFIQGFGIGLMASPFAVLAYTTLAPELRTEGAILNGMLRQLGGSLGLAGLQAFLINTSAAAHEGLAARLSPSDQVVRQALPHAFDGAAGALETLNAEVTRQAAMMAYDTVFAWMVVVSILVTPVVFLVSTGTGKPEPPPASEPEPAA